MTDNMNQRISARIRLERESRGWSLSELAERAGISRAMIHKIERGTVAQRRRCLPGYPVPSVLACLRSLRARKCRRANCYVWRTSPSGAIRKPTIYVVMCRRAAICLLTSSRWNCPRAAMCRCPPPLKALARQLIWLQAGELVFLEGDTRHEMKSGDCLELGPPNDCRFINETDESCLYLVVRLNQSGS